MSQDHPPSYYAATVAWPDPAPSLAGDVRADVCVVGGGFTGVSAALHLAERGYDVVLLEAKRIGFGASGRNGGQVGSGMRRDMRWIERACGPTAADEMWSLCEEARAILHERMDRHRIDCDWRSGNLLASTRARYLADLEAEAEFCARRFGFDGYRMLSREEVRREVATSGYHGGRLDARGGHLHPLKFLLGMAAAARAAGARLHERSAVRGIEAGDPLTVRTGAGTVTARFAVLAGNAYLGGVEARIEAKVMPIVNHILTTEPLGPARAGALIPGDWCVHSTKFVVDYYRRTADHRLLFGGGETYGHRPPRDLPGFVRRYMLSVFPQLADARIDHAWSGRLAISRNRLPDVGRLEPNLLYAQGFSGHGVALTQIVGKLLAEAVAGTAERFDVLASTRHRAFPGGTWLRHPLLVLGMLYYALRDRL